MGWATSQGGPVAVAPFTGAWIETGVGQWSCVTKTVAPFTGAWIETSKLGSHF